MASAIAPITRLRSPKAFPKSQANTCDRDSSKDEFIKGKIDILLGTAPIGTGVDGLQYVCDRLIIASLPWTHAEYEQLVGRIYRQKSAFTKVEVIIPQVILTHNDDIWSWDRQYRWSRIQWKKSLADTAIDGVIPKGELASEKVVLQKAGEALQTWIDRVESGEIYEINRQELRVPLPEAITKILQQQRDRSIQSLLDYIRISNHCGYKLVAIADVKQCANA